MIGHAREINWDDLRIAFPSFLTVIMMPLTYSIADGVLAGVLSNIALWVLMGGIDMGFALFKRDPQGRTAWRVFYDMFQCWRDAFEDFLPGIQAEWKGVFKNKVGAAVVVVVSHGDGAAASDALPCFEHSQLRGDNLADLPLPAFPLSLPPSVSALH